LIFWSTAIWQFRVLNDTDLVDHILLAGHIAAAGAIFGIPLPMIGRFFESITVHVVIITCWSILESVFALISIIPLQLVRFAFLGIYFPYLVGFLVTYLYNLSWEYLGVLIGVVSGLTGFLILLLLLVEEVALSHVSLYLNIGLLIVVALFLIYPILTVVVKKCRMKLVIY